jgi:hypothetical protein
MGRHEIRLRRQRRTASGAERFRNYGFVLERHEKEQRLRKIMRVFGFFAVILILVMIIVMLSRWAEKAAPVPADKTAYTTPNISQGLIRNPLNAQYGIADQV